MDIGSQKKYEAARAKRIGRKAGYQYSPNFTKKGGYRHLTEAECKEWYARLDQCLGKRMKVS